MLHHLLADQLYVYIPTARFATQCQAGMNKNGENNFQPRAVCVAKRDVLQPRGGGRAGKYSWPLPVLLCGKCHEKALSSPFMPAVTLYEHGRPLLGIQMA